MARRGREIEPEPLSNGPADLGWSRPATPPPSGMRPTAHKTKAPSGRTFHQPAMVADPHIQHGPFKILQRVDGPYVVFDTRAAPGEGAAATFPIERIQGEPKEDATKRTIKAAEAEAMRLAAELGESGTTA